MPWKLYYEIRSALPAVLYSDQYDTKAGALESVARHFRSTPRPPQR